MRIAALSIILSTYVLSGMHNEKLTQNQINAKNAYMNELKQELKQWRKEKQTQDTRIKRTRNPLTRFLLAMWGYRSIHDGPTFEIPYDWNTRNAERIKTNYTYLICNAKIIMILGLMVTGAKTIAAVKAELDNIMQQCAAQEKTLCPIKANSELVIADEFASATFRMKDNQLQWETTACFPSMEIRDHWADYKKYIQYK
jgi:hypothetical protein